MTFIAAHWWLWPITFAVSLLLYFLMRKTNRWLKETEYQIMTEDEYAIQHLKIVKVIFLFVWAMASVFGMIFSATFLALAVVKPFFH
jgi:hypothetical protein